MTQETMLELFGYLASLLILISLLMPSVVKLRIINAIGSAVFTIYAVLIKSYPTAVMNGVLVLVNLYYLWKFSRTKVLFSLVPAGAGEGSVQYLLEHYRKDIKVFFPKVDVNPEEGDTVYVIYADAAPAGLFIAKPLTDGALSVKLDYCTPQYRDCSMGTYLYGQLKKNGVPRLIAPVGCDKHNKYLEEMGFTKAGALYVKEH